MMIEGVREIIGKFGKGAKSPESGVLPTREDPLLAESRLSPTRRLLYGGVGTLGIASGLTMVVFYDVVTATLLKHGANITEALAVGWTGNIVYGLAMLPAGLALASAIKNRRYI